MDPSRSPRYGGIVIVRLDPMLSAIEGKSLAQAADIAKISPLSRVLADFGTPPSERLIQSVPVKRILELEEAAARTRLPPLFSLATFWRIDMREQIARVPEFLDRLRDVPAVLDAYPDSGASAPAVNPGNNPLFSMQDYLEAAPVGIDAKFAWLQASGDGSGISLVDLEEAWNFTHEDLAPRNPTLIFGDQAPDMGNQNHGTAALGVMTAADNTLGGLGVAPGAGPIRTASHYNATSATPGHVADAVMSATTTLAAGDVLVLEVETGRGNVTGWPDHYPIEIKDAEFAAIRLAVASSGIVVVAAAGNGGFNLDNYVSPQGSAAGQRVLNRSDPNFRDTGAIIVGAGSASSPHQPMSFTNYGSRVDCYAWGEQVATSGYGDYNPFSSRNQYYTTQFNGTSSATAIIGGAALVVQGVALAATGQRLSPAALQSALSDPTTGTPSNPGNAGIGPMPDLRRLLNKASLVPDIYIRDEVGDDGSVPSSGAVGASPDIILANQPVADPNAAFGQGSGAEMRDDLGDTAIANADNYVYVRMLNRGATAATQTTATVYWSEPATLVTPGSWNAIGKTPVLSVPQGDTLAVSGALVWPAAAVPASGHYCFVAVADSAQDPAPAIPGPTDWAGYLSFVQSQNNVAWRNFNVVAIMSPRQRLGAPFRFLIAGAPDEPRAFDFEIIQRLPSGARARLLLAPEVAAPLVRRQSWAARSVERVNAIDVLLPAAPRIGLAPTVLARGARYVSALALDLDPSVRLDGHSVVIRQLYCGIEVGRIGWKFVAGRSPEAARAGTARPRGRSRS
ncbi:MAG TPA: S8 family serine peptidase [Stellaceae bacterium]|nr:S8 family serine peptidase [Stellaceae bacterium]